MSYLLFLDESGHDHRSVPYEVRGGVALHAGRTWSFIQAMTHLEESAFGGPLQRYHIEIKGRTLLDKDRFAWAKQGPTLNDDQRRRHAMSFLNAGVKKRVPRRIAFTAYGQACLLMARGIYRLLLDHEAVLFASAIPSSARKPATFEAKDYLRKDHAFLLERYSCFLARQREYGLLVMDETDKGLDRQYVKRLEQYFTRTRTDRQRSAWVVPAPLFVSSDMTYPVQAADVCIYCINWGFRLPSIGMDAPTRPEIEEFAVWLKKLQFRGKREKDWNIDQPHGIVYVPDPYSERSVR